MRPRPAHLWIAGVLLLAFLHALAQARLRPLYQVSDELAYLNGAQEIALVGATPEASACIAPSDGRTLPLGVGGKAGFRHATGAMLGALCRDGGALPLLALRAVNAAALAVTAWAAFALGRKLGGVGAGALAALAVAAHPVAAKYAGGVTPDAWANAASGVALLLGARLVLGAARWWDFPLMWVASAVALLWKETTYVLIVHGVAVTAAVVLRPLMRRGGGFRLATRDGAVVLATLLVAAMVTVRFGQAFSTVYTLGEGRLKMTSAAEVATFATAVVRDAAKNATGVLGSGALSLYRPWVYRHADAHPQPLTPVGALFAIGSATAVAAIGLLRWRAAPASLLLIWGLTAAASVVQPSVRQVLLGTDDLHQGRWLFPLLAPAAALVGVGLTRSGRGGGRLLPLATLAASSTIALVLLDMARHYYLRVPEVLDHGVLFLRPTGDYDIGDERVLGIIESVGQAQSPASLWGILALLGTTCVLLVLAAPRDSDALHHDRHADHR